MIIREKKILYWIILLIHLIASIFSWQGRYLWLNVCIRNVRVGCYFVNFQTLNISRSATSACNRGARSACTIQPSIPPYFSKSITLFDLQPVLLDIYLKCH